MLFRVKAAALLLFALLPLTAHAQSQARVVTTCGTMIGPNYIQGSTSVLTMDPTGVLCTSAAGGGGGGLSVTDQAAFTQGVSQFTPNGGVFNDTATLSSGQQGTQRYTTKRAGIIDVDTTGNALYSAVTAPAPALAATTSTTNSYSNGATVPLNADLNGNLYVNAKIAGNTPVIGPTADGTAASTNPVLVAGTTDGTGTGAVAVPKVSAGGLVSVDGSAVTQPVSAASLPLPTGAATSVSQSVDPCTLATKVNVAISTATGTTQLVAPSGSTQVYICSIFTIGATASIQNIVGGTGATCATGTPVAVAGSTTAANGMSFAANGGFTFGNGGASVMRTTTAGHGVCLTQSATAQISGSITYVQQ